MFRKETFHHTKCSSFWNAGVSLLCSKLVNLPDKWSDIFQSLWLSECWKDKILKFLCRRQLLWEKEITVSIKAKIKKKCIQYFICIYFFFHKFVLCMNLVVIHLSPLTQTWIIIVAIKLILLNSPIFATMQKLEIYEGY